MGASAKVLRLTLISAAPSYNASEKFGIPRISQTSIRNKTVV
jgi:hypothetical protein